MSLVPSNYYDVLGSIESGGDPYAKSPTSSASGLFQFVKSTALKLGLPWGSDSSQPFGGANVSAVQQTSAAQALTQQNAAYLDAHGVPVNNATLYAAHFLGAGNANAVFGASPSTSLSDLLPAGVMKANSFLQGMSVGDFSSWLNGKTGGASGSAGSGSFRAGQHKRDDGGARARAVAANPSRKLGRRSV